MGLLGCWIFRLFDCCFFGCLVCWLVVCSNQRNTTGIILNFDRANQAHGNGVAVALRLCDTLVAWVGLAAWLPLTLIYFVVLPVASLLLAPSFAFAGVLAGLLALVFACFLLAFACFWLLLLAFACDGLRFLLLVFAWFC